jgi:CxxC motif-containing protein (DUF1111 family)
MPGKLGAPLLFSAALAGLVVCNPDVARSGDSLLARDPGLRAGAGAGEPVSGLTPTQAEFFNMGKVSFIEAEAVADGLGPRMNLDNCAGCHSQPATGGTTPPQNPQIALAKFNLGANASTLPAFVSLDGPVRVVRLIRNPDGKPEGTVQPLLTIVGRPDARGCALAQSDLPAEVAKGNVAFRIPTPVYGAGLIEQIPDSTIRANQEANAARNKTLGIGGHPNIVSPIDAAFRRGRNDATEDSIARFGWKAHNRSLLVAAAEAYHDEMGITNELFPVDLNESVTCEFTGPRYQEIKLDGLPPIDSIRRYLNPLGHRYPLEVDVLRERANAFAERNPPGDYLANTDGRATVDSVSSIEKFASFMRYLAPPKPSVDTPGGPGSIAKGRQMFDDVGCAACHTPTLRTGAARVAALSQQPVNLYSDLLLHDMGPGLADGVVQGQATGAEFRTSPLWGLGQRIFFLHDGRTRDLRIAIDAHRSGSAAKGDASEANTVIDRFQALAEADKQDLLNFLRSL